MKSKGKVNGAEIREQGMEDEGKAANTGKTKASVRGCIMETLGSGKELQFSRRKLGGCWVQFLIFLSFLETLVL